MSNDKEWYFYIIKNKNCTYAGVSPDPVQRLRKHNGEIKGGAKYTRANGPCELVYQEKSKDRSGASKREYEIKTMSRDDKLSLIKSQ